MNMRLCSWYIQDSGKKAGAPLSFATHAPLVFDKIGSGAKGSAGQRGAAKIRNLCAFSLPFAQDSLPRAVSALSPAASAAATAHFRCLCAFSLPWRIFATFAHLRCLCAFSLPHARFLYSHPRCPAHFRYLCLFAMN